MPTCPYCDEEKSALKNHVRLASGGGHGPSGEYPEDFDGASSQPTETATDGGAAAADPPAEDTPPDDAGGGVDPAASDDWLHADEVTEMLEEAREDAYNNGYNDGAEDGYAAGQNEAEAAVDAGDQSAEMELPCGHESFDPSAVLAQYNVTVQCETCSKSFDVVE